MRLFTCLVAALALTVLLSIGLEAISRGLSYGYLADHSVNPVGNALFILALAILIARGRRIALISPGTIAGAAAFIAAVIASAYMALVTADRSMQAAALLASPLGVIGYYPAGPDVPFDSGAEAWAVSAALAVVAGLLLGLFFRRLRGPVAEASRDRPGP